MRVFKYVFLGLMVAATSAEALNRPEDPVVITGSSLSSLTGTAVGNIVGFRYQGGWQQIPIQIDERDVIDLAKPYNAKPTGVTALQYCDPNTFTGADSNPLFDGNDELVFMVFDAGRRASGAEPAGVIAGSGLEVRITDPIDSSVGHVYLFRTNGGLPPGAGQQYVNYTFNVIGCSSYLSTLSSGNCKKQQEVSCGNTHKLFCGSG